MKVIVYQNPETGIASRIVPAPGINAESLVKKVPTGVSYKIVDNAAMPNSVLRDSWVFDGRSVSVDVEKGKGVANQIRRLHREEYMKGNLAVIEKAAVGIPLKAGESASRSKSDNAAYKKDVDDITQAEIEAALTEDDLLTALTNLKKRYEIKANEVQEGVFKRLWRILTTPMGEL